MRRVSEKTKIEQHRGSGTGIDYIPWIQVGEFGSAGTAVKAIDWTTGRTVHLLSQAEAKVWYILRWNDANLDICEQYPLVIKDTMALACQYGLPHSYSKEGRPVTMTTDFLIDTADSQIAVSVKCNWEAENERAVNRSRIEQLYWEKRGVPFQRISADKIDRTIYDNLRTVTAFYNETIFSDEISVLKHMIAHKIIQIDIKQPLQYRELLQENETSVRQYITDNQLCCLSTIKGGYIGK